MARRTLGELGVDVRLGARVTGVDDGGVTVGGERLEAGTVVWAAGNQASPLCATLGVPTDPTGRVKVAPDLSVPGYPEIAVIGFRNRMIVMLEWAWAYFTFRRGARLITGHWNGGQPG